MAIISNGTTIADAGAFSVSLGSKTLIKTLTASNSSTLSFVNGASSVVLDSTYPLYIFELINIHPGHSSYDDFLFNLSADTGSNYNVSKTSSYYGALSFENGAYSAIEYNASFDMHNDTGVSHLTDNTGNADDQCVSGIIELYAPSDTTFHKHYIIRMSNMESASYIDTFISGYANTTSAVDAIQFSFQGGNIASGKIKLYGIKDS